MSPTSNAMNETKEPLACPPGTDQRLQAIEQRLANGDRRMTLMQGELTQNTLVTTEVRELLEAARTGLKVLGWFGLGVKWCGGIAAALLSIWGFGYAVWYAMTHGGQLPK